MQSIFDPVRGCVPTTYVEDHDKVAFVISLLSGWARDWATAVWESEVACCDKFALFKEEVMKVFDCSVYRREASRLLAVLHQGKCFIADYAIELRTLAATCEWNEPALLASFLEGLNSDLNDEIYTRDFPASLDQLVELAIYLDKRVELRRSAWGVVSERPAAQPTPAVSFEAAQLPEPMQLGGIWISPAELRM